MHSVLIVATVDRGHGNSVGGQEEEFRGNNHKCWLFSALRPSSHARGRRTARRP